MPKIWHGECSFCLEDNLCFLKALLFQLYISLTSAFLLFISEIIVEPSMEANTFFTFETFSFFAIAAIDGPLPETEAARAPLSTRSVRTLGSEFSIVDVASPFSIIAFQ